MSVPRPSTRCGAPGDPVASRAPADATSVQVAFSSCRTGPDGEVEIAAGTDSGSAVARRSGGPSRKPLASPRARSRVSTLRRRSRSPAQAHPDKPLALQSTRSRQPRRRLLSRHRGGVRWARRGSPSSVTWTICSVMRQLASICATSARFFQTGASPCGLSSW